MSNYVNNLNELINTKNEFKEIIIESGQTPGEVFSYYPNMIRNAIAAGGGSLVDYPTYTYVATYYPDFTYLFSYVGDALSGIDVDIDLSSYVTKDELSAQSYVTSTDLENASYVTYSYVYNNYVKKGADITTPVAAIGNLRVEGELKVNSNTYSYNIIPQENNTYTLGDSSHQYAAAYASNIYTNRSYIGDINYLYNTSGGGLVINRNGSDVCSFLGGANIGISPQSNKGASLGNTQQMWNKVYAYTAYLQDTSYTKSIVPAETAAYTLGDADHLYARTYTVTIQSTSGGLIFRVGNSNTVTIGGGDMRPNTDGAQSLGRSSNHWNNGYINNIYTENVSYTSDKTSIKMNDRNIDFYANNKKMINLSDYNGFVPIQTNVNLGGSSNKWGSTYTSNLYADTIHNFIWTGTSAQYAALDNYTSYQIYMIKES